MQKDTGRTNGVLRFISNQRHYLAAALCVLLLCVAHGRGSPPPVLFPADPTPAVAPASAALPAFIHIDTLPGASMRVRAPRLTALPDGRLAAVWLGEGHGRYQADQAIWFSTLGDKGWHEAYALSTREDAAGYALAHLSAIGPPQVLAHAGRIDLWFEAHGPGLGSRPSIYAMVSHDAGQSWSAPRRLSVSPWLLGSSSHLSGAPRALADGGCLLRLGNDKSTQTLGLRLNAQGQVLTVQEAPAPHAPAASTALPSHGPHALLTLPDGRLLLAGSIDPEGSRLWLWSSTDAGRSWRALRQIAGTAPTPDTAPQPFDPALHLTPDGHIHLLYVRDGQSLQHLRFTPAWLAEGGAAP